MGVEIGEHAIRVMNDICRLTGRLCEEIAAGYTPTDDELQELEEQVENLEAELRELGVLQR